jgi:membrane dipeptidase
MLIDVAHINEQGFWDVIEISESPIIDSHSNAMAICDHPRNLKDEQIKAIAQKGGVIGLTCNSAMTSKENDYPTVEDLMKHLGHMIDIAGIDHVGLGPDLIEPHPGPPTESPGYLEGIQYVVRKSHYIEGVSDVSGMPLITEALLKRGYKDQDIRKILGENFLRVYKQVIG